MPPNPFARSYTPIQFDVRCDTDPATIVGGHVAHLASTALHTELVQRTPLDADQMWLVNYTDQPIQRQPSHRLPACGPIASTGALSMHPVLIERARQHRPAQIANKDVALELPDTRYRMEVATEARMF